MPTPNFIATPQFVYITNSALQMGQLGLERFRDTPKATPLLSGGVTIQSQVQRLLGRHVVNSNGQTRFKDKLWPHACWLLLFLA